MSVTPQIARRAVAYLRLSVDERISGSISFSVQSEHIEATALRLGTRGTLVRILQRKLAARGYPVRETGFMKITSIFLLFIGLPI